jgi:epoxyqueuosine reductase QueG
MIGRHGRIWRTFQEKELDHATQNRAGTSQINSASDMGSPDDNSDTEETETENMNTEGSHHEVYFGKARIPVTANPEHIITEMGKMVLLQGEHQGRTFQQVWSIDRKKTYTKWLKNRLDKVDIAYVAFTLYAEMKNILEQ